MKKLILSLLSLSLFIVSLLGCGKPRDSLGNSQEYPQNTLQRLPLTDEEISSLPYYEASQQECSALSFNVDGAKSVTISIYELESSNDSSLAFHKLESSSFKLEEEHSQGRFVYSFQKLPNESYLSKSIGNNKSNCLSKAEKIRTFDTANKTALALMEDVSISLGKEIPFYITAISSGDNVKLSLDEHFLKNPDQLFDDENISYLALATISFDKNEIKD